MSFVMYEIPSVYFQSFSGAIFSFMYAPEIRFANTTMFNRAL